MENEFVMDERIQTIVELLESKKYSRARDEILKNNTVDIAEILEEVIEDLGMEKTIILFRTLPKDVSAEVFAYLPIDDQIDIISGITDREIQHIIDELSIFGITQFTLSIIHCRYRIYWKLFNENN